MREQKRDEQKYLKIRKYFVSCTQTRVQIKIPKDLTLIATGKRCPKNITAAGTFYQQKFTFSNRLITNNFEQAQIFIDHHHHKVVTDRGKHYPLTKGVAK